MNQMTNALFKHIDQYYKRDFLTLDMELILNESMKIFERQTDLMSQSSARQAWTCFLEKTVICYI